MGDESKTVTLADAWANFQRLLDEVIAGVVRRQIAEDKRMLGALRGEGYWGVGKAPVDPGRLVGLAKDRK